MIDASRHPGTVTAVAPARAAASLVVQGLSHRYPGGERAALEDVTFSVEPGQRLGLLGPNGAGKSTLMRIACGYLPVQGGRQTRVEVAGLDVRTHSLGVRQQVGYMPEQVPLYAELRAREHLLFRARIKQVAWRRRKAEVERVAELTGIGHVLDRPIAELSRGYRQRVGLADALLGAPPLLVLDEPTVGLDPNQVLEIRAMLRELGGVQTLVLSSHILAEVEALCDRVVILSEGRVAADESLTEAMAAMHVEATWEAEAELVRSMVAEAFDAIEARVDAVDRSFELMETGERTSARIHLPAREGEAVADRLLEALGRVSARRGAALQLLRPGRTRLEERFAEVTGAARGGGTPQEGRDV
jgi:ABC-2 type transport system ATP-binding protein